MHDQILSSLNWRYATKKYDPQKKINDKDLQTILESLRLAPSSYGLQPWKFLVIENVALRKELRKVSWDQSIIEESSHLIVFCALNQMSKEHIQAHITNTAQTRNQSPQDLSGYQKFMEQKILNEKPIAEHKAWNQRQAYIAMGFAMETAALLKVDATPIEGLDPVQYDSILKINKTPFGAVAALALGYRSNEDKYAMAPKVRFNRDQVIEIIK
jgi:nitroreductase